MSDAYKSSFAAPSGQTVPRARCNVCGGPQDASCPYSRTQVDAQATLQGGLGGGIQAGVQFPHMPYNGFVGSCRMPMPGMSFDASFGAGAPPMQPYTQVVAPPPAVPYVMPGPQFQAQVGVPGMPVYPGAYPGAYPAPTVQTFTPGDNPMKAGMEIRKTQTMHWGIKLAMGGGILGVVILTLMFFFYEWQAGRLDLGWGKSRNTPTYADPGNPAASLYPGLPAPYLKGGFGFYIAVDQKRVYLAHDANTIQQVQANEAAASKDYVLVPVLKDAHKLVNSGTPSAMSDTLRQLQADAQALRATLHNYRSRFSVDEYNGTNGLKAQLDKVVTGVDTARGMAGGGD